MAETTAPNDSPRPKPEAPKKLRPTKVIPTERLTVKKQLDLLRAFAAASGPNGKPVTNREVAEILKMADTTVSLANYFFTETGLLAKGPNGFVPSAEVMSYSRAFEWNPATAAHKIAPLFAKAWFAEALTPKLSFRPMEEDEAINTLADASAAAPDYRPNLKMLVEFMEATGLVQREGTQIKLSRITATADPGAQEPVLEREQPAAITAPQTSRSTISTAFTQQPTEGVVQFHISVRVDMGEFANWRPDRIAAFFGGIATVLAAKAAVEKDAGIEK